MASSNPPDGTRVNAFEVGRDFLFRHYFDDEVAFRRLERYYDSHRYRFEVPADEFDAVRRFLREGGYRLEPVGRPESYVVVVRQYTAHPDCVFSTSVLRRSHDGHNLFLLADRSAVDRAVAHGARRLDETAFTMRFDGGQRRLTVDG